SNSICTLSVNVTPTTSGPKPNTTGPITSNEGGDGGTASATLLVGTPPTITKSFSDATIPLNSSTTLTFKTSYSAPMPVAGGGFTATLPAGLVVATPNNLHNTCGGTATAVAGSSTVSLSGATLSAGSGPVHSSAKLSPSVAKGRSVTPNVPA